MGLIILKIIGYGILIFFVFGVVAMVLTAVVQLVSFIAFPFLIAGFLLLSVVTYPITILLRYRGYTCRSFFQYGLDKWNKTDNVSSDESHQERTQERPRYEKIREETYKPPPQPKKPSIDPWNVLGVARGASKDAITAAYRQKIKKNHPDKLAELDPELQKYATQRTILIRNAYEQIIGI